MLVQVRTVPWHKERLRWAEGLRDSLQRMEGIEAGLILDENRSGMDTWLKALHEQGPEQGCWHLEDDVILTMRFHTRIRALVWQHGKHVIQGWAPRKEDREKGSRFTSRTFYGLLATWIPPGMAPDLAQYTRNRRDEAERGGQKAFFDVLVGEYLKSVDQRYWIEHPSLIQHREGPSATGPRSSRRLDPGFED